MNKIFKTYKRLYALHAVQLRGALSSQTIKKSHEKKFS